MRTIMTILCTVWAVALISCIDDDDRCGNLEWQPRSLWCAGELDTTPVVVDTAVDTDTDSAAVPIMGEKCNSDADCAQYNTNYCVLAQQGDNFCTLKNCSTTPNNCPGGYTCCVMTPGTDYLTHCMPNDIYTSMGASLCVQ